MKKKGVGRKQRSCYELVTQSTDREERNLRPARGPVPKSHIRVSMGLTRQPAKVRGHGEFLSLGAELGDTWSISFLPSWRGTTNPDTQASHNSNDFFCKQATKFQIRKPGKKPCAGKVFPHSSASGFHSLATSPRASAGVQEQEGRNGYIL